MRLTTKIFVLLALVVVSLFVVNSGNQARADNIPAGQDTIIINLTTDFLGSQVVLSGTMTLDRGAQTGTNTIECEIIAMQLTGTYLGTALTLTAGSQNGLSPSFCTIEETPPETLVVFDFLANVFFQVDLDNDGSVDALNCGGNAIPFGSTLPEVPIASQVSFGPSNTGVPLCDPQGNLVGSFGESAFVGVDGPVAPPGAPGGPPAVGGIAGLTAEDGSLRGSESSSSASAMTLILLGVGFVSIVALATGGWYLRRRLIP